MNGPLLVLLAAAMLPTQDALDANLEVGSGGRNPDVRVPSAPPALFTVDQFGELVYNENAAFGTSTPRVSRDPSGAVPARRVDGGATAFAGPPRPYSGGRMSTRVDTRATRPLVSTRLSTQISTRVR